MHRKLPLLMISLALLTAALVVSVEVPASHRWMRVTVQREQPWILEGTAASSRLENGRRVLLAAYVEHQLAARVAAGVPKDDDDVKSAVRLLRALYPLLANQEAVSHAPASRPVLLSGVGYCDQLNGVAARVLAARFGTAEVFALRDASGVSNHSIGRFWSAARRQWVYFDTYYDDLIVFTFDQGRVAYLVRERQEGRRRGELPDDAAFDQLYQQATYGTTLKRFHRSLVAEVLMTATARFRRERAAPPSAPDAAAVGAGQDKKWELIRIHKDRAVELRRIYLDARLAHLYDDTEAVALYQRILSRNRGELEKLVLVASAQWFHQQLAARASGDAPAEVTASGSGGRFRGAAR